MSGWSGLCGACKLYPEQSHTYDANCQAPRPATRVDDVVIFPDGTSRPLTADEIRRLDAGEELRLDPRSGRPTPKVGEVFP